jgi:hypothetical protein
LQSSLLTNSLQSRLLKSLARQSAKAVKITLG